METIFKLYNQTTDPNYIGQDTNAREIIDIASIINLVKPTYRKIRGSRT